MFIRIKNHMYNVNQFKSITIGNKDVSAMFIDGYKIVLTKGEPSELQEYWDNIVDELKKRALVIAETA